MKLTARQKSWITILILNILGILIGYGIWLTREILHREECGLLSCIGKKSDDFRVGNGTRIFLISKLQPSSSNVFFIQTSCDIDQRDHVNLSPEQACSIYSAAIQNPSRKVILLYTCPYATDLNTTGVLRTLLDLPNFHFVQQNRTKLFDRVFERLAPNSTGPILYDDDGAIQFLVVFMFGGTYMNMDLMNVRPLDHLGVNFIGAQSEYSIGNYFFNFEPNHQFLKELLLAMHNLAGNITIDLLTEVLRKSCNLEEGYKFDKSHDLTQCKLKVLASTLLFNSDGTGHTSKSSLLVNESTSPFGPFIRPVRNQNRGNQINQLMMQRCAEIYGHKIEGNASYAHATEPNASGSVLQAYDYLTFRKLSPYHNNIYFLETSCTSTSHLNPSKPLNESGFGHITSDPPVLSVRQACAIYSTAHYNPSKEVILIYTCHGFADISSGLVKTLFDLPNFSMGRVNLEDFYNKTLDAKMRLSLKRSEFPGQHDADMLRLLLLYLYGGTYMDMDIISLKPLNDLGKNFIGAEDYNHVANGVLSFEAHHKFIRKCLKEAIHIYKPSMWSSVGALLILSVITNHCELEMIPQMNWSDWTPFKTVRHFKTCNMKVLPRETFYAVPYPEFTRFYYESEWPAVQSELEHSYIAHFWNHMGSYPVYLFGEQPYAKLAKQHCNPILEYTLKKGFFYLE